MSTFNSHLLLFLLPGVVGNILHMVIVKRNLWSFLAIPLSEWAFGRNKTWRGFLFLPVVMAGLSALLSLAVGPINQSIATDSLLGAGLGLAYMLFELPNSFVKRRLGIATGESSGRYKTLQLLIDKTDSLFGTCLFYYWATDIHFSDVLWFFLIAFTLHLSISTLLYRIKLKKAI